MNTLRFVLGLCLLLPLVARAQNNGATPPKPLLVRFLFLDESAGAYSVKAGATLVDLGTQPYAISAPVELPPGSRLEVQKVFPDPKTGAPVRTRVLSHDAPAGLTHALAVVAPAVATAADGSRNYRVRFYDVAPAKTPARSIRILNLSPIPMAARFGETNVEVVPWAEQLVSPTFDKRNRVRSFVATRAEGDWKMVFNSFLSLQETTRLTGVMVYSASGMRHTYTDAELAVQGPPKPGCFWLTFSDSI